MPDQSHFPVFGGYLWTNGKFRVEWGGPGSVRLSLSWLSILRCGSGVERKSSKFKRIGKLDKKGVFVVKLTLREKESIQDAVRRFRKLIERSGIKKEMRRREHFEKPSEVKRRAKLRAVRRNKRMIEIAQNPRLATM